MALWYRIMACVLAVFGLYYMNQIDSNTARAIVLTLDALLIAIYELIIVIEKQGKNSGR